MGFRVQGLGFGVSGLGRFKGSGFGVSGFGFRVWSFLGLSRTSSQDLLDAVASLLG